MTGFDDEEFDRRELSTEELLERLEGAKQEFSGEGRPEAVEKQHDHGKLTAREHVEYLCDNGTFRELGQLAGPSPNTPET